MLQCCTYILMMISIFLVHLQLHHSDIDSDKLCSNDALLFTVFQWSGALINIDFEVCIRKPRDVFANWAR